MNKVPIVLSSICSERPRAKITGNTTRPATNATVKSASEMITASRLMFSSGARYDAYVSMIPMPTLNEKNAWLAACCSTERFATAPSEGLR